MWSCSAQNIQMTVGDYGVELPISFHGAVLTERDEVRFLIKQSGKLILSKIFENIIDNVIKLTLTEEESSLMKVGSYRYSLDWYQDGVFMCNIIPSAKFEVVPKL